MHDNKFLLHVVGCIVGEMWCFVSDPMFSAVIQMQDQPEMTMKEDETGDDQQSDDLSLSIPLPSTPASVSVCCDARSSLVFRFFRVLVLI